MRICSASCSARAEAVEQREQAERRRGRAREDRLQIGLAERLLGAEQHRRAARPATRIGGQSGDAAEDRQHARRAGTRPPSPSSPRAGRSETGVGATIARGSQKWNGTCADFVKAPSSTSTSAGRHSGRRASSRATRVGSRGDRAEIENVPVDLPDQQKPDRHREPAERRHLQRRERAALRVVVLVPKPISRNEREARDLPEHEQQDQVVGERDAEHRAHEGRERRVVAADARAAERRARRSRASTGRRARRCRRPAARRRAPKPSARSAEARRRATAPIRGPTAPRSLRPTTDSTAQNDVTAAATMTSADQRPSTRR